MTLKEIAQTALRGTARAELPKLPPSPLADVLARLETANPEAALLSRAALAGLHARAGAPLLRAENPPPETLPPAPNPLPEKLWPLLRRLADTPAFAGAVADIQARGWTLNAVQVLSLTEKERAAHLWPLLDERGQAVLDTHPLHAAWVKADAQAKWAAQLDALRDLRQRDPEAGAAQTLQLWPELKADERREVLGVMEGHLTPADLPLLKHAEKDRSGEIARRVRELQGHLPGPLQDEFVALLPQAVKTQGKGWKMTPFDLPDALGKVKVSAYDDSDHHRLFGALPFGLILATLGLEAEALIVAAGKQHWSLKSQLETQWRDWQRQHLPDTPAAEPTEPPAPVLSLPQQAQKLLEHIQHAGNTGLTQNDLERFARLLDPAAEVPAPQPLPFVAPDAPGSLPRGWTKLEWEQQQSAQHQARQDTAEAAWRELSEVLRLRREWAQGLEEFK